MLAIDCLSVQAQQKQIIDGSKYYNLPAKSVDCEIIECPQIYQDFKGIWTGEFQSYDQNIKDFRPFHNKVVYDGLCYKNIKKGEIFVVGIKIDEYPEYKGLPSMTDTSYLITGMTLGKKPRPFLRAIDKSNGLIEYKKIFEDKSLEMSVWEYDMAPNGNQPAMKFRIFDYRNIENSEKNERIVDITMEVGPPDKPYWTGLIVKGSHAKGIK